MKNMHWWCYVGYEDLFKAVYHRPYTEEEGEVFKKMTRTERNNWILEHIGLTNGLFVALDQRAETGFIAFTMLPYLCKGLADGEIEVPEGKTEFVIPHDGPTQYGFVVERTGRRYTVVSVWDNDETDFGEATISVDEQGDLHDFRNKSPKFGYRKYNFDANCWEQDN